MAEEESIDCTVHLLSLTSDVTVVGILDAISQNDTTRNSILVKGRAHGWVHLLYKDNVKELRAHEWHLFLLARYSLQPELGSSDAIAAVISIAVSIPAAQYEDLLVNRHTFPRPMEATPPLPNEWTQNRGSIPKAAILRANKSSPLRPGELRMYPAMADFLSKALPDEVKDKPVSLFNLFKYAKGDRSVHDHYMEDFKDKFGDAAGATVKFMGPVRSEVAYKASGSAATANDGVKLWDDANLVQYDTIWHYAYMLSTDVYQELNKEKMKGLEDTCILLVSEVELMG